MKRALLLLVLLAFTVSGSAQNWNPFTPGVKRYFTNNYGYLKGMRIDSVAAYGSDLHYYPFKTKRAHVDGGYWPWDTSQVAGSWLGEVIVRKPNGDYLIPNYWGDTIFIKPQAGVGDSWVFYSDGMANYYVASITFADTMTISGTIDSIKSIVLNAYSNGSPMPTDSFDNLEIVISKAHGFYQVPELYMFPFHEPDTSLVVQDYFFYNSVMPWDNYGFGWNPGLPNESNCLFRLVDYQPRSAAEIHNWNVGDVFEYSSCWGMICSGPDKYHLDTVISKVTEWNGVYYGMKGWLATGNGSYFILEPHTDTIFFSSLPDTLMYEEYRQFTAGDLHHYLPDDTSFCINSDLHYTFAYYAGLPGWSGYSVYKDGVGLLKSHSTSPPEDTDKELIYFVKNGIPCGNFVMPDTSAPVVNATSNLNTEAALKVYPNPADDQLNIDGAVNGYQLSLINTVGQVVYEKSNCSNKESIDVTGYAPGVYHLKLKNGTGEVVNRKIIIQH